MIVTHLIAKLLLSTRSYQFSDIFHINFSATFFIAAVFFTAPLFDLLRLGQGSVERGPRRARGFLGLGLGFRLGLGGKRGGGKKQCTHISHIMRYLQVKFAINFIFFSSGVALFIIQYRNRMKKVCILTKYFYINIYIFIILKYVVLIYNKNIKYFTCRKVRKPIILINTKYNTNSTSDKYKIQNIYPQWRCLSKVVLRWYNGYDAEFVVQRCGFKSHPQLVFYRFGTPARLNEKPPRKAPRGC